MEISHSELEKDHYQALKNPAYQIEGMIDVLREEMMMNMPYPQEVPQERIEPRWERKQWDIVEQLRAEVTGWREKHAKALFEIDKLNAKVGRTPKDTYSII